MKACEDDDFQTQKLTLETLRPTYPNVILVDQKVADQDVARSLNDHLFKCPNLRSKPVTNQLSKALDLIRTHVQRGGKIAWSIVLKEGLYIDPDIDICSSLWQLNVSIEIVGLNDVRILALKAREVPIVISGVNFCFKNVRLYDRRKDTHPAFIHLKNRACVVMNGVQVSSPMSIAVTAVDGVCVEIQGCAFRFTPRCIGVSDAKVNMNFSTVSECRHKTWPVIQLCNRASFSATKARFIDIGRILVYGRCQISFLVCVVQSGPRPKLSDKDKERAPERPVHLFDVMGCSVLECKRSFIFGYPCLALVMGSKTRATFDECTIATTAIGEVRDNASLEVFNSRIYTLFLFTVKKCVAKPSQFKNNKLDKKAKTLKVLFVDEVSERPLTDICDVEFSSTLSDLPPREPLGMGRIAYMQLMNGFAERERNSDVMPLSCDQYTKCAFCYTPAGQIDNMAGMLNLAPLTLESFIHCSDCEFGSYCSSQCQTEHLSDHQLLFHGQ